LTIAGTRICALDLKMRVSRYEEFIIGGYSIGGRTFDAVILGHVVDGKLVYVARTRSEFTPALRAELLRKMKPLEVEVCPSCSLPKSGRVAGAKG
jgi:ATP-dependent DNA ligase